ncbi:MAG: SpoVR family protein [Bacteroidetes bacterium]|nr:MAG: SpoVR family protein [Bacteroidota bacterium]TAG86443.1 MAG: SpoVR family protein [Bacteroidota bacterium]
MELISQHVKKLMEECKLKAIDAGLKFESDTLEYIVTNKDMIELTPKIMIPTLYDYWVNDVEVLKESGKYKLYPNNPYETVINSRPAISFYNDNNPDWLNVMIFYHVLGHIDFFQNNRLFAHTWKDDFVGKALADKRLLADMRTKYGRWVDYVIEFTRSINNLNGYFVELAKNQHNNSENTILSKVEFYLQDFLQVIKKRPDSEIFKEVERLNLWYEKSDDVDYAETMFLIEVKDKYPELQAEFDKYMANVHQPKNQDLLEFIRDNSPFLHKSENTWMKEVMTIVRDTAVYFEPQIRTKIINEGWASYWHDTLFRQDKQMKTHEIAYAKLNAMVTSVQRVGLNPYAIGLRLVQYVEELANEGKISRDFQDLTGVNSREKYDKKTGKGRDAIFDLRTHFSDFTLVKTFTDQDFVDKHDLFVVGKRINYQKQTEEYYVKSRKAEDYQAMLVDSLYHPPYVYVDKSRTDDNELCLVHLFEGKPLLQDFIADTLLGIEFLWGGRVLLETVEITIAQNGVATERPIFYVISNKKVKKMYR